ncbi:hypothetical protein SARC_11494 [Sphaeroforma arctica JP610]|uniref:Uncharacterized protein n=1 Tax=Sphaeroforma arctica JP610 TaxID=667725 RepID=A0A0L0FIY4_9EUKA|nr:hypothetical protein SARC_11494 [Sphaeroforma arctica JP610]KNC75993.1 hypothetical protein SARC_11494 [Sphaeroforma arctica JP610]|eukprot:XP_014149895.1 hypothetical protein SARC_11494 [Sphaeroforma arctica JP610]
MVEWCDYCTLPEDSATSFLISPRCAMVGVDKSQQRHHSTTLCVHSKASQLQHPLHAPTSHRAFVEDNPLSPFVHGLRVSSSPLPATADAASTDPSLVEGPAVGRAPQTSALAIWAVVLFGLAILATGVCCITVYCKRQKRKRDIQNLRNVYSMTGRPSAADHSLKFGQARFGEDNILSVSRDSLPPNPSMVNPDPRCNYDEQADPYAEPDLIGDLSTTDTNSKLVDVAMGERPTATRTKTRAQRTHTLIPTFADITSPQPANAATRSSAYAEGAVPDFMPSSPTMPHILSVRARGVLGVDSDDHFGSNGH